MIGRRGFITGLVSLVAAPAIVRAGSLMPVKMMVEVDPLYGIGPAYAALKYYRQDWAQHWEEVARIYLSDASYKHWQTYR